MTFKHPPYDGSSRTIVLDSVRVRDERRKRGWSQRRMAEETDRTVRKLALLEDEARDRGQFWRRLILHTRRMQLAGIAVATISSIERGKPVYLETAVIVSETLGVPLDELLPPASSSRATSATTDEGEIRPGL